MTLHPDDRIAETGRSKFRDYILTDYEPRAEPVGRLRSESVYRWALRENGLLERCWPAVEALVAHLGPDETVWGIKWGPGGFTTELYFYNNANNPTGHPMQCTTLSEVLAPWLTIDSVVDERLPYFMCSIDLDAAALEDPALGWCVYLGTGEQRRKQSGFSYRIHGVHHTLENHYWFYDPRTELDEVSRRLRTSPRIRRNTGDRAMPLYMLDCHTVCVAIKPHHDGFYMSRLTTEQARRFCAEHGLHAVASLFEAHADDLAHLCWDIGYDVRLDDDGNELIEKVGVYGIL